MGQNIIVLDVSIVRTTTVIEKDPFHQEELELAVIAAAAVDLDRLVWDHVRLRHRREEEEEATVEHIHPK